MKYFIGLDIGTSAAKGALVSIDGCVAATEGCKFQYVEKEGGRLLDPDHFVEVCASVIRKLVARVDSKSEVLALCPCHASGNLLLLDETLQPMTPIIGWQSRIDEKLFAAYFSEEERDKLYEIIGWRPSSGFPLAYLVWLKENRPELLTKADKIVMSAEYLNFTLTGEWGISRSMATPFYLADQEKGEYYKPLLERFGIDERKLPPIYEKGKVIGRINDKASFITSLPVGVPVVLGSFDHPSCATGSGVYDEGEMLLSCGTSWVEFFPCKNRAQAIARRKLTDSFMLNDTKWCNMLSVPSISSKIDSFITSLFGEISYKAFDELCLGAAKGAKCPEFDFETMDTAVAKGFGKCEIAKGIIESAARLLLSNLETAEKIGLKADKITMVGGMTNSDVCVQIIAETLKRDIRVVNGVNAGAVGAAMLAGIGIGFYRDERDAFNKMSFSEKIYRA